MLKREPNNFEGREEKTMGTDETVKQILRFVCSSVECCPYEDDSGWTSNPETDMDS